jgi:hypothetical protein
LSRSFITIILSVILLVGANTTVASSLQDVGEQRDTPVESFQVLELPLSVTNVALTHAERADLLKCTLANNSSSRILGLRYLLFVVDSANKVVNTISRTEGFRLAGYGSKTLTFRSPVRLKLKAGYRLELMLEQVVGEESIWEVAKARDVLEAYVSGDYSVMPQVLRVSNQVDVPPRARVFY